MQRPQFNLAPLPSDEQGVTQEGPPGGCGAREMGMQTQRLLDCGERGIHLLFDTPLIAEAFGQDARSLRRNVDEQLAENQTADQHVLELPSPEIAREFIACLPRNLQHVLVLLYFELLDDRLRKRETRH